MAIYSQESSLVWWVLGEVKVNQDDQNGLEEGPW